MTSALSLMTSHLSIVPAPSWVPARVQRRGLASANGDRHVPVILPRSIALCCGFCSNPPTGVQTLKLASFDAGRGEFLRQVTNRHPDPCPRPRSGIYFAFSQSANQDLEPGNSEQTNGNRRTDHARIGNPLTGAPAGPALRGSHGISARSEGSSFAERRYQSGPGVCLWPTHLARIRLVAAPRVRAGRSVKLVTKDLILPDFVLIVRCGSSADPAQIPGSRAPKRIPQAFADKPIRAFPVAPVRRVGEFIFPSRRCHHHAPISTPALPSHDHRSLNWRRRRARKLFGSGCF